MFSYRGFFRLGKVTKYFANYENFLQRNNPRKGTPGAHATLF